MGKIKNSLINQLKHKKANVDHFLKLVDDYEFYDKKEREMHKNITKNGTCIKGFSSSGLPITKENPDCKTAVMFNKQKLAILKQMGLTTDDVGSDDDDEM